MNKKLIAILFLMAPLAIFAQNATLKFGHFNSSEIMEALPDSKKAEVTLSNLQQDYAKKIGELETEFSKNVARYEEEKATLPESIRARREADLASQQNSMQEQVLIYQQQLQATYEEEMVKINDKIIKAVKAVGTEGGFLYIVDVNRGGIPYISETLSTDVTAQVKAKLGIQ